MKYLALFLTYAVVLSALFGLVVYAVLITRHPKRYRSYEAYLRSPRWRKLSAAARKRDGHRCSNKRCGSREHLEVHHLSYPKVWGTEKLSMLVTLCHDCHMARHRLRKIA